MGSLKTRLTSALGIEHPVMSAGMARVAQAPLVAAVSEAGGMGCLGGVSYMPDKLRAEIRSIRARTRRPFAVNLVVPKALLAGEDAPEWDAIRRHWAELSEGERQRMGGVAPMLTPGSVEGQVEVVLDERPAVLVLTFDVPETLVRQCRERGVKVMALCGSIGAARAAAAAGVDFIVAQGSEGGGHTGHVGTFALIPTIVDAVDVPVVAAGGIVDGRGLAAALCLGAEGVWCGTRFIATPEAYGHDAYKARVLAAGAKDTTLSKSYTGKNLRTLRNEWTADWEAHPERAVATFPGQYAVAGERVESGYLDGDVKQGMMPVGQAVASVQDIRPAGEIVRWLVSGASEMLARRAGR